MHTTFYPNSDYGILEKCVLFLWTDLFGNRTNFYYDQLCSVSGPYTPDIEGDKCVLTPETSTEEMYVRFNIQTTSVKRVSTKPPQTILSHS